MPERRDENTEIARVWLFCLRWKKTMKESIMKQNISSCEYYVFLLLSDMMKRGVIKNTKQDYTK
jgi:hypothetical protein